MLDRVCCFPSIIEHPILQVEYYGHQLSCVRDTGRGKSDTVPRSCCVGGTDKIRVPGFHHRCDIHREFASRAGGGRGGGGIFATRVRPKSKKRKHVMLNGGKRKVKHEKKRKTASCWRDGEKVCTCEHEHEHDMHMHMCMQNIANQNIAHTLAVREEPLHVSPTQRTARVGRDVGSKHFLCPFPGPRAVSR
jgi:hypothetical protein